MRTRWPLLLLMASLPLMAAPSIVVYRCIAADGSVTLQNGHACPKGKGTRGERRTIQTPVAPSRPASPVAAPAPTRPPAATPLAPVAAPAPVVELPIRPAPEIFTCGTNDDRYFADTAVSNRCAPLTAVGLDGATPSSASACEVVADVCEPVPEAERCAAWAERARIAEGALRFQPERADAARDELAAVAASVAGTACAR